MADSISGSSDADLIIIAGTVLAALTANPTAYGLTAADATTLDTSLNTFQASVSGS